MNLCIVWLVLALSEIGQSNVAVDSRCAEDYWPCSCHQFITSTNQSRLVIRCNEARSVNIVELMLRRTRSSDIHAFYMTLPEEQSGKQNQDQENTIFWQTFFSNVNVQNIHLTCPTNNFQLTIASAFQFSSSLSMLSIEHIHIDNCDVTHVEWSFLSDLSFLKRLTLSRIPNLQLMNLPELISLNTLNITNLSVIHEGFTPPSNTSIPYLTSLMIDYSKINPKSYTDAFLGRTLEHFLNQYRYRYLESVSMNGYQMGDSSLTHIFSMLSHETKRNTLRTLSLANNGLTRIPKLEMFPNLVTLILDKNNFTKLENYSLQRNGSQLQVLSLSACQIHLIEPAALEGIINTSQMNLTLNFADNNLTRFESTVFKNLLRNMAKWNNTGSIDVSHNPFNCDCHLTWLLIENRHLLDHIKGARCASNGFLFKDRKLAFKLAACGQHTVPL